MCTVTVHRTDTSLLVTMNRDEARLRAPEIPPRTMRGQANPLQWIAPADGQAGGTWFGANEYAVQACLLNRYLPDDAKKVALADARPSRGRIIVELLERGREAEALTWLRDEFDPRPYPSFWLVVVGPQETRSFAWDGHTLEDRRHDEPWLLFSSSSWRTDEVLAYRKVEFDTWLAQGASYVGPIPSFHLMQPPDRVQWAPLMDREHSATRSVTQTETDFTQHVTVMRHWPRENLKPLTAPLTMLELHHAPMAPPSHHQPLGRDP